MAFKRNPGWEEVGTFWMLRVPAGTAVLTVWINPFYAHGLILFANGTTIHVPHTDHFANQVHMANLPGKDLGTYPSSFDAAMHYCEWRLGILNQPVDLTIPTAWERLSGV
jgi:hypothetical protein